MSAAARPEGASLAITFLYYRDLASAAQFYEDVLGLPLAIHQGWSRIYRLAPGAHVGLVDETKGAHRASDTKPVQICLRVPDVDAWHGWAETQHVSALTPVRESADLGIRVFTFEDPEGHQIEIQTPTREGA